jgi:hypothetical protein
VGKRLGRRREGNVTMDFREVHFLVLEVNFSDSGSCALPAFDTNGVEPTVLLVQC